MPRAVRRLLAASLLDDLVGDVRGNLGVRVELHRVRSLARGLGPQVANVPEHLGQRHEGVEDRKSTRLNSSHMSISYAVFCLKKKKNKKRSSRYKNKTN